MQPVWDRNTFLFMSPSCMHHFAVQIHYNGDDVSALIFVCCIYGTVLRWPCTNRPYVCIASCALELKWRVYWRSMQFYEVIIQPHMPFYCQHTLSIIMAMTALCWSLFVERMERVSCCLWTDRPYVCIAVCVLECEGVIGVRCSMWS